MTAARGRRSTAARNSRESDDELRRAVVDPGRQSGKILPMSTSPIVSADDVEKTITAFTRLDQRGDKKAMNKLAQRLQKEQPFLLQFAAAVRTEHGDQVGEAAVFYATLVWAMFDRGGNGTLPRLTAQNLADADRVVTEQLSKV